MQVAEMTFWTTVALASIALIGTIIAGLGICFAYRNINVLREQHRRNTFLTLMAEISGQTARDDRKIVYNTLKNLAQKLIVDNIKYYTNKDRVTNSWEERVGHAFEETIVTFDKLGFFLLRGDPKLIDEAPIWLWDITSEMWDYLGRYIEYVQKNEPNRKSYGKYFKELADVAKIRQEQAS